MTFQSKFLKPLSMFIVIIGLAITSSCSKEDIPDLPDISKNHQLNGTKWTNRSFDFDIASDASWAYLFTDIDEIFFYSNTEGIFYHARKTIDSDYGKSFTREVCFFNYYVKDGKVCLENLTDPISSFSNTLSFNNNTIELHNTPMISADINSNDRAWIESIQGMSGNCKWYYDLVKKLYIIGNGKMEDYTSYNKTPWNSKYMAIDEVSIGKGVKNVGKYAFASPSVGNVTFCGKEIESIAKGAFEGSCIGEVVLPPSIKKIEADAFANCKYAIIYLPDGIVEVGESAFSGCKSVSLAATPSLSVINTLAFSGTTIKAWTNSKVIKKIGNGALYNPASLIDLPEIEELGNYAISGTRLSEVHIGNKLKKVYAPAFEGATSGKLYINMGDPLTLSEDIVANAKGWTLYVPNGSESAYKTAPYWKNFKSIVGSDKLDDIGDSNPENQSSGPVSDVKISAKAFSATITVTIPEQANSEYKNYEFHYGTNPNYIIDGGLISYMDANITSNGFTLNLCGNLNPETEYFYYIEAENSKGKFEQTEVKSFTTTAPKNAESLSYTIDGKRFEFVKVEGLPTGDFYIMQTELPIKSELVIEGVSVGPLDTNNDNYIATYEYAKLLYPLRDATQIQFELPTADEWTYAAKGGKYSKGYKYSGSDNLDEVGWYKSNGSKTVHEPAQLKPNELGLYDMSGNCGEVVSGKYTVDGDIYGGDCTCEASECTPLSYTVQPVSGKIPGTNFFNQNVFDARCTTIRLVYPAGR